MTYTEKNIRFKKGLIKAVNELSPYDEHLVMLYWNNGCIDYKIETLAETCNDTREDKISAIDGGKVSKRYLRYWIASVLRDCDLGWNK